MKEFKVGDEVIMKGRVVEVFDGDDTNYPIRVLFNGSFMYYTEEGKFYKKDPSPSLFHAQPTERLVEVRDNDFEPWQTRVFCKEIDGRYYTWANATTLEEAKTSSGLRGWDKMREIPTKKKITLAEIAEKFGVSVDEIEIGE
jgi:hypothetical protein